MAASIEIPKDALPGIAEDIASDVLYHIDTMYPQLWDGLPTTARARVRITIIEKVLAAFI